MKANIGHTKAAAGVAGLIKAALSLREEVLPPATACLAPHAELEREDATLRVAREAESWPEGAPLRAAVSAMGFGGINTHVVLEGLREPLRAALPKRVRRLGSSVQDAELFLVGAADASGLDAQLARLEGLAAEASRNSAWASDVASCQKPSWPSSLPECARSGRRSSDTCVV